MDIVITIPKKVKWEDYQKELDAVRDGNQMMLYHLPFKPKHNLKGNNCFLCYRGYIVGFMLIINVFYSDGFTCSTTGVPWPEGWYVCRTGPLFLLNHPIPMKGFRGIRYVDGLLKEKIDTEMPTLPTMINQAML